MLIQLLPPPLIIEATRTVVPDILESVVGTMAELLPEAESAKAAVQPAPITSIGSVNATGTGVLTVTKQVDWNGNTPDPTKQFTINIAGPDNYNHVDILTEGQTKVYTDLVTGIYTITESSPGADWGTSYLTNGTISSTTSSVVAVTNNDPTELPPFLIQFHEPNTDVQITIANDRRSATVTGNVLDRNTLLPTGITYEVDITVTGGPDGSSPVPFPSYIVQQPARIYDVANRGVFVSDIGLGIEFEGRIKDEPSNGQHTIFRDSTHEMEVVLTLSNGHQFKDSRVTFQDIDGQFVDSDAPSTCLQPGGSEPDNYNCMYSYIDQIHVLSGIGSNIYTLASAAQQRITGDTITAYYPDADGDLYPDSVGDWDNLHSDYDLAVFMENPTAQDEIRFIYTDPGYGLDGDSDGYHDFDARNQFIRFVVDYFDVETDGTVEIYNTAPLPPQVLIGNRVWIEDDNDGDATTGAVTPVVGATVTATASDGTTYTDITDASGNYTISVPANGVYTVTVGTPAGTMVAVPTGGLVATDSDPNTDNDTSHDPAGTVVTVGAENNLTIDFGFYELPPAMPSLALSKTLNTAEPVEVGQPVSFTIRITNTGNVTITTLPLMDTYDTNYLSYDSIVGSMPATDDNADDGQLDWSDLTSTEGGLGPGDVIEVIVNFTAAADTSDIATAQAPCTNAGESCNVATVDGAMAGTDPVPPVTDSDDVEIEEQVTGKSTLGDFVWFDTNSDGIKDPGEPGINGVVINLYDSSGLITTTVTMSDTDGIGDDTGVTNGDGFYDFQVLPSTVYTVEIDPSNFAPGGVLEGYTYTGNNSTQLYNGDETRVVGMPAVQHDENNVDFSYVTHSLGNYVWLDSDNSGDVTAGEQPIPDGVVMELLDSGGTVVMSTTTTSGYYLFDGLAAGDYQVRVAASNFQSGGLLENHTSSTGAAQEADPDSDGDQNDNGLDGGVLATDGIVSAAVTIGSTEPISETVTASGTAGDDGAGTPDGNSNLAVDFGIRPPLGSIGDTIWGDMDEDGDGVLDGTDVPLSGVVVELEMPDGSTITTTTNVSGTYLFADLPYGTYTVTVDVTTLPPGYLTTPSYDPESDGDSTSVVTLDGTTPDNMDQDFSYPPDVQPVLIGDRVWIEDDNDGLATTGVITPVVGSVVTAIGSDGTVYTNTTDAMGYYTITVPANDVYTVTVGTPMGTVVAVPTGGLVATDNDPNSDDDTSHDPAGTVVTVGAEDNLTIDFGFYPPMMSFELSKTLNTPSPARVGEKISFTIRITNTGSTVMTTVPLTDTYDNHYMSHTLVGYPEPDIKTPGELVWHDLTSTGAAGFGIDLNPGETFAVIVEFVTKNDTTGLPNDSTINLATSQGITDTEEVQAFSPTSVDFVMREVIYDNDKVVVQWQTADESDVVGFHIYRAVVGDDDSKPIKLTPEVMIAEKSGSPSGASYTYEDESAEVSVDYRYFVGILDTKGFETQKALGEVTTRRTVDEWLVFLPITMK